MKRGWQTATQSNVMKLFFPGWGDSVGFFQAQHGNGFQQVELKLNKPFQTSELVKRMWTWTYEHNDNINYD